MTTWNVIRCKCAIPDCSEEDKVFDSMSTVRLHLYHEHGVSFVDDYEKVKQCLILVEYIPRRTWAVAFEEWARSKGYDPVANDEATTLLRIGFEQGWKACRPRRRKP